MANKTISDLPDGMVSEILVRLPVKTLLICKSVCKPWLSMISNPHFVKSQLRRAIIASMNTPTLLTIQTPPPTAEELAFEKTMAEMEKNFVTYTAPAYERLQQRRRQLVKQAVLDAKGQDLSTSPVHFDRLVMPRLFFAYYGVVSCCNGIICLANGFGNAVYLWNPSIRKCKKLPHPEPYDSRIMPVKIGFGYDSISDSYKVFRVVSEKMYDKVPIVQVYSTSTDSWREFRDPILKNYENFDRINVVINGVLYFDGQEELIAFDLHTETFRIVPFPSFRHIKRSELLDFQGSVAMVFQSESGFDLWTLDDVSGQVTWTKKFGIEVDSETELCLSKYLGGGHFFGIKLLLNQNIRLYNVLYDYQKKETKFYKVREENVCAYLKYTETLVSPDGFEPVDETPTASVSEKKGVDKTPAASVSQNKSVDETPTASVWENKGVDKTPAASVSQNKSVDETPTASAS